MAGKKKNNNNEDDDLKQEGNIKLQAVLLADALFGSKITKREEYQSFGLRPWSSEDSTSFQTLCKLNNLPIVDYILDFLASNGVEQVIVVTGSESSQLEEYLKTHNKWNLEVLFLKDTSLTNAGDALRELYKRNWIRASKQALPFLLVSGDVVADLDLQDAMKAHKDRHSHDSAAVMTVVLKPIQATSTTTKPSIVPRASDLIVGLVPASSKTVVTADAQGSEPNPDIDDSKDYRILYYDNGGNSGGSSCTVPCSFLTQSQTESTSSSKGGLVLRHDLLDTGIAICSPDVLGRLEDEFDYLDLAHDFLSNSVAEEEEGLQTRIYAHVLEHPTSTNRPFRNYAAKVVDFQTFHAISQDLLQRWAYPQVADRMILGEGAKRYKLVKVADHNHHRRNNKQPLKVLENTKSTDDDAFSKISKAHNTNQYQYKEVLNPTKVGRTTTVVGPGMMGSYGSIGEDCLVARCVLGDSVSIGDGSRLVDCHVMDDVVIESGATLDSCVLASGAVIKAGATLGTGCYVGEACVIGAGITVAPFTRVTLAKDDDDDDWGDDDDDDGFSDTDDDSDDDDSSEDEQMQADTAKATSSGDCDVQLVGTDGKGKLWKPTLDDDDYSDDDEDSDGYDPLENLLQLQSIGGDPTAYYRREERRLAAREAQDLEDDGFSDHDDEDDEDEMAETQAFSEFTGGTVTFGDDDDDNLNYTGAHVAAAQEVIGRQKGIDVVKEMTEICMDFDDECHPIENLAIELNSFKFSQNATYGDCAQACLLSLLRKMEVSPAMSDGRLVSLLKAKLDKFWTGMLQKVCRGMDEEISILEALEHAATIDQLADSSSTTTKSDAESVDALQKATEIAQKLRSGLAFRFVLQTLHDQEVLSEEAILKWASKHRESPNANDPKQSLFEMKSVQDFLEWLEDEDSSDDDDSDGDSSDEDSD